MKKSARFGAFVWRGDGAYAFADAVRTFSSEKVAQKWCDREPQRGKNLVVRTLALTRGGPAVREWVVTRRSGWQYSTPRELYRGEDEARARAVFAREGAALRQGSVALVDPDGAEVDRRWGPRLRTRW